VSADHHDPAAHDTSAVASATLSRLLEILSRRPPFVAPADLIGQPGHTFGFTTQPEFQGWTVTAFGADGRRLGRPLKGLSESAAATLTRPPDQTANASDLQRLADAWSYACKHGVTNADVLTAFADAAARMSLDGSPMSRG
jgi:hypothetical protein